MSPRAGGSISCVLAVPLGSSGTKRGMPLAWCPQANEPMTAPQRSLSPGAPHLGRSPPSRIQQTDTGLAATGGLLPEDALLAQPGPGSVE